MKKRFFVIAISVLLAVTFVTAFSAYAKPPVRVNVYGVLYGSGNNSSWIQVQVTPVTYNTFGLTASSTLELVTQIAFYFKIDTDSFTSFTLSLKKLSSALQDNTSVTLNNVDIACYSGIGPNVGYYSLQNKTQTLRTVNSDGTTDYNWTFVSQTGAITGKPFIKVIIPLQNFMLSSTPFYFETTSFYVNGEPAVLNYTEQKLDEMMNYDSQGGSPDTEGASDMVETIAGDVSDINNTIQQHTPHVQNWFETSPVASDLVNIALLANSWLPAYLNCDPDVSFYWGLVTFCILLTLIENGLRRRPWHGFDDGGDFESEYDVTSTDEKGRSRTIHNKVSGSRRRVR